MRRERLRVALLMLLACGVVHAAPPAPPPEPAPATDEADEAKDAEDAEDTPAATPSAVKPTVPPATQFTYGVVTTAVESGFVGRTSFTVTQGGPVPNVGFGAVRVTLKNGPVRDVAVVSYTPQESGRSVTRTVELGPGERRSVVLPVPNATYGSVHVRTSEGFSDGQRMYFNALPGRVVLVLGTSAQMKEVFGEPLDAESRHVAKANVGTLAPDLLSGELAELAGYDAVVLAGARLEDLSQAQARALEAYAATGGRLTVLNPGPGTAARLPWLEDTRDGVHPYGFGQVRLCADRKSACARAAGTDALQRYPAVRPAGSGERTYSAAASLYGISRAQHFLLPQATPPVGRFVLILAVFCVAIGPGSVLVARRRGPSMLLFTIPATALATCLVIVGYSLVVDGFATHAHALGLSLLDRKHDRVVTVGNAAVYANLSPGSARFGASSAVILPWGARQGSSVDWTEGATFGRDFIPARTYRELGVLSVDPSRARLVAKREGGAVRVQNGLGAPIRWGLVKVGGGLFELHDLADGAEARFQLASGKQPEWQRDAAEDLARFSDDVVDRFKAPLAERDFVALLDGPGPLPLGGLSAEHDHSQHLMRGEVE